MCTLPSNFKERVFTCPTGCGRVTKSGETINNPPAFKDQPHVSAVVAASPWRRAGFSTVWGWLGTTDGVMEMHCWVSIVLNERLKFSPPSEEECQGVAVVGF